MAERLSLVRKGLVVVTCRALGLPVVLHLHAAELHRAWPTLPAPARALARWMFSLPRACIVLGPQSAEFVTGALRVPPERVVSVSNGVPPPRRARRRRERDGLELLFVGNLSARKGLPELLQAMAQPVLATLPITLTLAGGGDLPGWRARADRLGLGERVRFCGWTDGAKLAGLMASADALVLPSHDEGLPLVILEALAQGLPVVCTPVGEIAACLQDGRHALFVPPGDAVALARALARLLGDTTLRGQLALEGRALWQREFSITRFFCRIAAVHRRCFGVCAALAEGAEEGRVMRLIDAELAGPFLREIGADRRSDPMRSDARPGDVMPGDFIPGEANWSGGARPSASPGAAT
jgi:glycosyltransferase involved in cell wall biosynthesis